MGVCSVASSIGGSTVRLHSEVAYGWSFFPFKMLCKVNRAVDTQCKIQSNCDQTILQMCIVVYFESVTVCACFI